MNATYAKGLARTKILEVLAWSCNALGIPTYLYKCAVLFCFGAEWCKIFSSALNIDVSPWPPLH